MASLTYLYAPSIQLTDAREAPIAATVGALTASIAGSDGVLTSREYVAGLGAADAIAGLSDDPAVLRSLILRGFENGERLSAVAMQNEVEAPASSAAVHSPPHELFSPPISPFHALVEGGTN